MSFGRTWFSGVAAVVLLFCAAGPLRVKAEEGAGLRVQWAGADHASGVYSPNGTGRVTVVIENPTGGALPLGGALEFGPAVESGGAFKAMSVTPIKPTTLAAGERATVTLGFQFGNVGAYELRWAHEGGSMVVQNGAGEKLECIFAPRVNAEGRWLGILPKQAASVPGYLSDLAGETGVHRFLLEERFAFDLEQNVGLAAGASLGASEQQIDGMFQEAAKSHVGVVLRVTVPGGDVDPRMITAFHAYIENAVRRGAGSLQGIVVMPGGNPTTEAERGLYRRFYLAAYEAAKAGDKSIVMLGAGTAFLTRDLLANEGLIKYVDGLAVTDAAGQPLVAAGMGKLPLWVMPAPGGEAPAAAIALAEDGAVVTVPAPGADHGATAHLLGGAAFYQKLSAAGYPYVAAFQGDGYAVAAVAGQGAGTPLDALYPALEKGRTTVEAAGEAGKGANANLEVADEPGSMRVVDGAGAAVDCRDDDTLYVPAGEKVVYVIAGGTAEDLMSILRVAEGNRLPVADVGVVKGESGVGVRVRNITGEELRGKVRVLAGDGTVIGEKEVVVGAGQEVEVPAAGVEGKKEVTVEVVTSGAHGVVQRTELVVGK